MNQDEMVRQIDEALERFAGRDLVASAEVVDFLLDLRLAALAEPDAALERLLEEESEHAV